MKPFRVIARLAILCGTLVLAGCMMQPSVEPLLPTATVEPTPVTPTPTATFLPPPTVTPFPTVTQRAAPPTDEAEAGDQGEAGADAEDAAEEPPTAAPTEAPEATNPPPTGSGAAASGVPEGITVLDVVLNERFDRGWPSEESATATYGLQGGAYVFNIGPFDGRFINTTQIDEDNFYAQVDVTPTNCPAEAGYGLFFRYGDADNYYALTLFCEGTYRIVARVNGALTGGETVELSGAAPDEATTHSLGVLAQGSEFTFYFDGEVIGTYSDAQLTTGDVALYALSGGGDAITVAFDNLRVWTVN